MTAADRFSLRLLGSFLLTAADGTAVSLRRQPRALLTYLAVNPPQSRQTLTDLFCVDTQSPNRTLNVLLSRIRRATAADAVQSTPAGALTLNATRFRVDYTAFIAALSGGLDVADERLETAVVGCRGEFLEGFSIPSSPEFELWLLGQRAHVRRLLERGLLTLIERYAAAGRIDAALGHARRLLQQNPLLEPAHFHLIRLYTRAGQHEAARRQYDRCRDLFQAELGVDPSLPFQDLSEPAPSPRKLLAPPAPDFVGRSAELVRLQSAWRQAEAGVGSTLLLRAPAGGGKSRLAAELLDGLSRTAVYHAACYESTRSLPLHPWLLILETHLQRLDDIDLQELPPASQTILADLLPGFGRRLLHAAATGPALPGAAAVEPERLFAAVADFLSQPSLPRLFFIDDLQWADETSLRLFHYLSLRASRFPWLLIGALRSEDAGQSSALAQFGDDLARRGVPQLTLAPLETAEIAALTAYFWPQLPAEQRNKAAETLLEAAGGNPLLVSAMLRELAGHDQLPATLPIPGTVQELLERRLRRLPAGGEPVWAVLAVLDSPAGLNQLQDISGRSDEETAQALDLGFRWGLLAVDADSPVTRYRFHHDLVREGVYATVSAARRQQLHRRAAFWLAGRAQNRSAADREAAAGTILYHAQQGEAFDLIFQWAPAAAAAARRRFAFGDGMCALDALRAAYLQLETQPDFDRDQAAPVLFTQLIWWLTYSWVLGKPVEEEAAVLQQAEMLLLRAPTPLHTALLDYVRAQIRLDYAAQIPAMRQAHRRFLQLEEGSLAAAALATAASAAITISRNRDGRALYRDALALNRQADDPAGEIHCLTGLAWTALNLGEIEEARAHAKQALDLSRTRGDKLGEAQALFGLAACWTFYHHPQQIAAQAGAAQGLYLEIGFAARGVRPLLYLAAAQDMRGEWVAARKAYADTLAAALVVQDHWTAGWAAQLAGRIYLRHGELEQAADKLEQARQLRLNSGEKQNQVSDLAWLGRLALHQGDKTAALAHTAAAMALLEEGGGDFYVWEQPDVLLCRAEALAAAGEMPAAQEAAQQAQETLHRFAAQITDPAVRDRFWDYPSNRRVRAAAAGHIVTWPEHGESGTFTA